MVICVYVCTECSCGGDDVLVRRSAEVKDKTPRGRERDTHVQYQRQPLTTTYMNA